MTKSIYIAVALALITIGCDKGSETNSTELPKDPTDGLGEIYDFSNVDLENVNYWEEYGNGGLPNKYKYIYGRKKLNDSFFFVAIIFDEQTKKPIYQFTDYDRPITYTAYGEERHYDYNNNGIALLHDRLVLLMNYKGDNIKTRTDYIEVYKDGSCKRTTLEEDASEFQLSNWNSDHILFYIPYETRRPLTTSISYIYDTSTSKIIYKGIFYWIEHMDYDSTYIELMPGFDKAIYIVSDSDPLRFCTYHSANNTMNFHIVEVSPDFQLYELQKQAILCTGSPSLPLDEMFDNFISDGDYPDKIEHGIPEQISYCSVLVEVTRTAFSGRIDTCRVIISIDEGGNTIFDIQGKQ